MSLNLTSTQLNFIAVIIQIDMRDIWFWQSKFIHWIYNTPVWKNGSPALIRSIPDALIGP